MSRRKPIVLLKGGRSSRGGAAVRTHTGALAGAYEVLRAALAQAGVVEVRRSDELFQVARTLAEQPAMSPQTGAAVLSDGGGHGVLAADALVEADVPLATLSPETRDRLRALLGPAAAVGNPVDLAGASDRDPAVFARAHEILLNDAAVGAVLMVGLFGGYAIRFDPALAEAETRAADAMSVQAASRRKALIVHSLYAAPRGPWSPETPVQAHLEALASLIRGGVPVVESLDLACRCVAAIRERGRVLRTPARAHSPTRTPSPAERSAAAAALQPAADENRAWLLEPEGHALVAAYGVRVPDGIFCPSEDDVVAALRQLGPPVALKIVAPAIVHKAEASGVALDVTDAAGARAAYARLVAAAQEYVRRQGASPDVRGVWVARMMPWPLAELLVGVHRDATFGPTLTVGAGGATVEIRRDFAVRVLPVVRDDVLEMMEELRSADLLRGARGRAPADRIAVAELGLALARCLVAYPQLEEIEANPVFAYEEGAVAVDVRARLAAAGDATDRRWPH